MEEITEDLGLDPRENLHIGYFSFLFLLKC